MGLLIWLIVPLENNYYKPKGKASPYFQVNQTDFLLKNLTSFFISNKCANLCPNENNLSFEF